MKRDEKRDDHLIWLTRLALGPLALLSTIFGPMLFLFPSHTDVTWSWQIRPEMSAIVVGAGYIFGSLAITTLLVMNRWHALNTAIFATWIFSVAMLLATLLHLDRFFVGTFRFYVWFVIYVALPLALPVAWFFNRRYSAPRKPEDLVFTWPLRIAMLFVGSLFMLFGLFMFIFPSGAAAIWPWQLTPLMSQVIGGWIMFVGAGGMVIFFEPRYSAYRALIPATVVWDVALLIGSLLHLDNFDFNHLSPWIWFLTLLGLIFANSAVLATFEFLSWRRRARRAPAPTPA